MKFDSFFNQLEKLIDINPIYKCNNKFILKFLNNNNDKYPPYSSFHNGFPLRFPLFQLLIQMMLINLLWLIPQLNASRLYKCFTLCENLVLFEIGDDSKITEIDAICFRGSNNITMMISIRLNIKFNEANDDLISFWK